MGNSPSNASALGARTEQSTGAGTEAPPTDSQRGHGGQSSVRAFFGLRIGDTAAPTRGEVKAVPAQGKAVPPPASLTVPVGSQTRLAAVNDAVRDAVFYGDARPSTPAMRLAAAESTLRDEHDWQELADLAAHPEWDRALPYGSVETACALND